jgi:hypothetical protein
MVGAVTVTPAQIKLATLAQDSRGDRLVYNIPVIAQVADETGFTFYHLLALFEQESRGLNIYGKHDEGGTFQGFKDPVTECNYRAFYHEVVIRGRPSNGVGPGQLTWRGYHEDMQAKGLKCWDLKQNMDYSAKIYWGYWLKARKAGWSVRSSIQWAGTWYNAGSDEDKIIDYGRALEAKAAKWRALIGVADTEN